MSEFRLFSFKQAGKTMKVQSNRCGKCPEYTSERFVDHKLGFERCILAYSGSSQDEEVDGFHLGKEM